LLRKRFKTIKQRTLKFMSFISRYLLISYPVSKLW